MTVCVDEKINLEMVFVVNQIGQISLEAHDRQGSHVLGVLHNPEHSNLTHTDALGACML